MSVNGDFYRYSAGDLVPVDVALADPLTVADSWLVVNGQSRALARHLKRFAAGITDEISQDQLPEFFRLAIEKIPVVGEWFPRLEYRLDQELGERLFLRLRTAPERTDTCTLWTYDQADPRVSPEIKGPDLSTCQRLRRAANLHGADEAVLVDERGFISDGALSAIVWWEKDVLCAPDESTPWLPSITRELVFELAHQAGFETRTCTRRPNQLDGCEVWSLSSLQGIRGVTDWAGMEVGELQLLAPFRKRLQMLAEPISSGLALYLP